MTSKHVQVATSFSVVVPLCLHWRFFDFHVVSTYFQFDNIFLALETTSAGPSYYARRTVEYKSVTRARGPAHLSSVVVRAAVGCRRSVQVMILSSLVCYSIVMKRCAPQSISNAALVRSRRRQYVCSRNFSYVQSGPAWWRRLLLHSARFSLLWCTIAHPKSNHRFSPTLLLGWHSHRAAAYLTLKWPFSGRPRNCGVTPTMGSPQ